MMGPYVCLDCDLRADSSETEREKIMYWKALQKGKITEIIFFPRGSHFYRNISCLLPSPFPKICSILSNMLSFCFWEITSMFLCEPVRACVCMCISTCVLKNYLSTLSNEIQNFNHKLDPEFPLPERDDPPLFGCLGTWWDSMTQSKHLYVYSAVFWTALLKNKRYFKLFLSGHLNFEYIANTQKILNTTPKISCPLGVKKQQGISKKNHAALATIWQRESSRFLIPTLLLLSINITKLLFNYILAIWSIILFKSKCIWAPIKLICIRKVKQGSSKRWAFPAMPQGSGF